MKKILIMSGGTIAAWHICSVIKKCYSDEFIICISDIYDKEFVSSSILADEFYKVPTVFSEDYYESMKSIIVNQDMNCVVPIIDKDLFFFSCDNAVLKENNILSTAPPLISCNTLSDKRKMHEFMLDIDVYTPDLVSFSEVKSDNSYFVKPAIGFGSRDSGVMEGLEIKNKGAKYFDEGEYIIQELCDNGSEEITAEVYSDYCNNLIHIFQRERVETKAGACTKARLVRYSQIENSIKKIYKNIQLPVASCFQFVRYKGNWSVIDCNLRLGAGTAIATKYGFQLTRAMLGCLLGRKPNAELFRVNDKISSVVRVYDEVAIMKNSY